MRRLVMFGVVGVATLVLNGCTGPSLDSGVPEKIDMTKDYTPPVDMPGMSPKIQKASAAKAKAEAAKTGDTPDAK